MFTFIVKFPPFGLLKTLHVIFKLNQKHSNNRRVPAWGLTTGDCGAFSVA